MPPALAQKPHPSPRNSFSTQPPTRHRQTSALARPSLAPRAAPGTCRPTSFQKQLLFLSSSFPPQPEPQDPFLQTRDPLGLVLPGPAWLQVLRTRPSRLGLRASFLQSSHGASRSPSTQPCTSGIWQDSRTPASTPSSLLQKLVLPPSCPAQAAPLPSTRQGPPPSHPAATSRGHSRLRPALLSVWPCRLLGGPSRVRHPASLSCSSRPLFLNTHVLRGHALLPTCTTSP